MSTDAGEFCDDGNDVSTDACIDCRNTVSGDGCPATCRFYQSSGLQPHSFQELTNGSTLAFSDNDDGRTSVTLPFTFEVGGVPTSSLAVSVNGFVSTLSIDPATSFDNVGNPSAAVPNGIIAPWWDDLVLDDSIPGGASTSTAMEGAAPNRRYVIEWLDLRSTTHNSNNHRRWTFQLVLEETSNNIAFRYADTETRGRVPSAVAASSGVEDESGTLGIEALGCSPGCSGPQRQGNRPDGFPEQTELILSP